MKKKYTKSLIDFITEDVKEVGTEKFDRDCLKKQIEILEKEPCILTDLKYTSESIYEIYKRLIVTINSKCRKQNKYENDLILISAQLLDYKFNNQDKLTLKEKDTISYAIAQCRLYLNSFNEIESLLDEINDQKRFKKEIKFLKYYSRKLTSSSSKKFIVYIINVSSSEFPSEYIHIQELREYYFPNITLIYYNSFDYKSLKVLLAKISKNSIVFIRGHGSEETKEFISYKQRGLERIDSNYIKKAIKKKDLLLLSILTCAHDSFQDLGNITDNLILPIKSGSYLNESIIKSFLQVLSKTGDIGEAYNFSRNSVFNYSIDGYTIKMY